MRKQHEDHRMINAKPHVSFTRSRPVPARQPISVGWCFFRISAGAKVDFGCGRRAREGKGTLIASCSHGRKTKGGFHTSKRASVATKSYFSLVTIGLSLCFGKAKPRIATVKLPTLVHNSSRATITLKEFVWLSAAHAPDDHCEKLSLHESFQKSARRCPSPPWSTCEMVALWKDPFFIGTLASRQQYFLLIIKPQSMPSRFIVAFFEIEGGLVSRVKTPWEPPPSESSTPQ